MLRIIILLVCLAFAQPLHATCGHDHGDAPATVQQSVPTSPVSNMGTVTGGACASDADCFQGCINGDNTKRIICITKAEGSDACIGILGVPFGGLACGCLPDAKRCGYALPKMPSL
jgi:hypothetical protein